ncbi:MAG: 3D domain-containing protein [Defluviitaleaceae bacterium]|nr:3D domain-containing protein [Defluviitaleaceae bacterium]MCL2263427.1 3D domain-containing protein [Defluviitaleaceae bacterium]
MKSIKAILVLTLAVIAVIVFPLGVINFIAAESALTQVVWHDGNETHEFLVGADTVGGFLHEAGISTGTADRLSHAPDALLWDGIEITIEREIEYYVQLDGEVPTRRVSPPGTTIAEVHRQLQQETSTPLVFDGDMYAVVQNGDNLSFGSWRTRYELELIPLPYETILNHTNSVSRGREHLRVVGEYGEKAITTSVLYIAGVEDRREIRSTEILAEPINAILDIGTGWLGALADVNAPDFHYVRRVRMEATAYTAGYCCTGKHPDDPWYGITASGRRVEHGIVAVDRNIIPLGTRLYVENYGFAIAADVGGAIRGYKIDLFMYDLADALRFGRRHIYVWILDEIV